MTKEEAAVAMENILRGTVEALVDAPESVAVVMRREQGSVVFSVTAAPEDVGKVIGKQGRTARSLRVILGAISRNAGETYELVIVEADRPEKAGK